MEIKADLAKKWAGMLLFRYSVEWLSTGNIFRGRRSWSERGRAKLLRSNVLDSYIKCFLDSVTEKSTL